MSENSEDEEKTLKEGVECKTGRELISFKGLCINCENRYVCTLPKLPGGVWYCEEYM